jgi:hypothetical protein
MISGSQEGGIVARQHLLKDTASGAHQHALRTYKGTAKTAEADGTKQILAHLKVACNVWENIAHSVTHIFPSGRNQKSL